MSKTPLDRRINAYRDDLAAESLRGKVEAKQFAKGELRQNIASLSPIRQAPRFDAPLETEMLFGERAVLFAVEEGWAWVQAELDGYVGYSSSDALVEQITTPTHRVRALRSHLYPGPDIKVPPFDILSMNSQVVVESIDGRFAKLSTGLFIIAAHLDPVDEFAVDFVAVAEQFLGAPYVWGGRTSIALDCSALVQLSLQAAGVSVPRDTDMQEAAIGEPLSDPHDQSAYARGDLIFWKGHVGIMLDETRLLHCNVHHMAVAIEPVAEAIARIEASEGKVISVRRGAGET